MSTTAVSRPLRRIYLVGLTCALAAAIIGIALERARFGSDDAEAAAGVRRSITDEISAATSTLQEIADAVAREPALFDAAAVDAAGSGVRALLDRADQVIRGRPPGLFAVTAYRPSGVWPLAWSGPASDVAADVVAGPESFVLTPGALGLRLLYIKPVVDPADSRRVGVVVAERVVTQSQGIRTGVSEGRLVMGTTVPVTVEPYDPVLADSRSVFTAPDGSRCSWRRSPTGRSARPDRRGVPAHRR